MQPTLHFLQTQQGPINLNRLLRLPVVNARLTTSIMLTAATYLHHACFLGFAAILATVLAIFPGRTVTRPMRALCTRFVSHDLKPPLRRWAGRGLFNWC